MSRTLLALLLADLVVLVGVSLGHAQDAPATLVITVPEDARILIDGKATRNSGGSRTFVSPPLETGANYSYEVTVEVVRDGKTLAKTRSVRVGAGETTKVDFSTFVAEDQAPPNDAGWLREFTDDEGNRGELHQPQVDEWRNGLIRFRMAVALTPRSQTEPAYGGLFSSRHRFGE